MKSKRGLLILLSVFVCFSCSKAWAHGAGSMSAAGAGAPEEGEISSIGMINSPTATTLDKGHVEAGFTFEYVNYNQIPALTAHSLHEDGREVHGFQHSELYDFSLGAGIMEDFDLFLEAPIVSNAVNQLEDEEAVGRDERSTGFGDMRLTGKYRFWEKGVEAALIAGIKFPTGKTAGHDRSDAKFAPEIQPGSGSWDGEFGLAVSRSFAGRFSAATSFQYFLRSKGAQEFDGGDIFRFSAGVAAALRPYGRHPNVNFHIELNNKWERMDHEGGVKTFDSGGTTVALTPGISFDFSEHVSAFWGMVLPIYQNLGGEHEETEYRILTGIGIVG